MEQEKYLSERLEDQINWYSSKSTLNKKMYYRINLLMLLLSASIPVMATFTSLSSSCSRVLLGTAGALVTILAGVSSMFKFQEKWSNYRTTSETLKHHKYLYLTQTYPYNSTDAFNKLVRTVESAISTENSTWDSIIKSNNDVSPSGGIKQM